MNAEQCSPGAAFWGVEVEFDPEQAAAAAASRDRAQARFAQPIATQIEAAGTSRPGEDYHQRDLEKRGLATCAV